MLFVVAVADAASVGKYGSAQHPSQSIERNL